MINSKQKGKLGEREVVNLLKKIGFTAKRTQQYKGTPQSADVEIKELPTAHIEVKKNSKMRIGNHLWIEAKKQCLRDKDKKQIPLLFWHERNYGWRLSFRVSCRCSQCWFTVHRLKDMKTILDAFIARRDEKIFKCTSNDLACV